MSTITKERAAGIARGEKCYTHDDVVELARIALASLEAEKNAEPVAKVETVGVCWYADNGVPRKPAVGTELFTAPPEPVSVPDLTALDNLSGEMLNHAMNCERRVAIAYTHCAHRLAEQVRDLRAAMLQGADGNSPVIPDGWVACSERMPDKLIPVMVMYADGEMWSAIWTGTKWDDGTELPDPHAVTHWQEMPAAPQQEA
jgi:hypothetical protein